MVQGGHGGVARTECYIGMNKLLQYHPSQSAISARNLTVRYTANSPYPGGYQSCSGLLIPANPGGSRCAFEKGRLQGFIYN